MLSNKKRLISKEYLIKCIISSLDLQKSVCKVNNQHWVMILGISHALKTGMILSLKSQKSLSVDTVHHAINKCRLKTDCHPLWVKPHLNWTEAKTVSWSDLNPNLKIFLENMDSAASRLKRRGAVQLVISRQFKNLHV